MSDYQDLLDNLEQIDGFSTIGNLGKKAAAAIRALIAERDEARESDSACELLYRDACKNFAAQLDRAEAAEAALDALNK